MSRVSREEWVGLDWGFRHVGRCTGVSFGVFFLWCLYSMHEIPCSMVLRYLESISLRMFWWLVFADGYDE